MNNKLTKQQAAALNKLRAMQPFAVRPARTIRARESGKMVEIPAVIETGVNTQTLFSLRNAGLIKCASLWLRGNVSPDLEIL